MTPKQRKAMEKAREALANMASDLGRFESEIPEIAALDAALAEPAEQEDNSLTALRDMLRVEVDRLIAAKEPQPAKRVELTVDEINTLPEAKGSWPIGIKGRVLRLIRAAIAAYEAKNGIKE